MLWPILTFELRAALRQPTFWWLSAGYFLFALVYSSSSVVGSTLSTTAVNVNAPWAITRMVTHLSYLGLLGVAAFAGASVVRDFQSGVAQILFCTQLRKPGYVFGRFLGGFLAALLSFSFIMLGLMVGPAMPWADAPLLGPFPATGLLAAFVMFVLPNMFIGSGLLFAIALLTRSHLATYVGAVAILVGFFISRAFAGAFYATPDAQRIAGLVEPFGTDAAMLAVLDWTPFERNTIPVFAQGYIGYNRLLWVVLTLAVLLIAYRWFTFTVVSRAEGGGRLKRTKGSRKSKGTESSQSSQSSQAGSITATGPLPTDAPTTGMRPLSSLQQLARLTGFETVRILRSAPFGIMLLLSCAALWFWALMYGRAYGTGFYPYTLHMAAHIRTVFEVPLIAMLTFFAADLTWSTRMRRADEIIEATPTPTGVLFGSKLLTLFALVGVTLLAGVVTAVMFQWFRGFMDIDWGVYAVSALVIELPYFLVMATFALMLQSVAGHRFVGMLAMVGLYVFSLVAVEMGVRHNLLIPGGRHPVHHNALAGFGHYLTPIVWFHLWWMLIAAIVGVFAGLIWQRGKEAGWRVRWQHLRDGFRRGTVRITAAGLCLATLGVGGFIGYQTLFINPTPSEAAVEAKAAEYERQYNHLRDQPQPNITAVTGELHLFPDTRHFEFTARYDLVNRTGIPLTEIMLTARPETRFTHIEAPGVMSVQRDTRHGVRRLQLSEPLEPGEQLTVNFTVQSEPIRGFRNRAERTPVAHDGSLLFYNHFLPVPGYARDRELSDELARADHGLPERPSGVRSADDPRALREHEGQPYANWLSLDMTLITDADQVAVGQGRLVEHRVNGDRAMFRYVTDVPVKLHMGIASGRYKQVVGTYEGTRGPVEVSVFHMPGHGRNAAALLASLKGSLRTIESAFGPYPYDRLKLIEVAMDRPTFRLRSDTILADSSLGFINDPRLGESRDEPGLLVKLPASMVANLYVQSMVMAANQPGATSIPDGLGFYLSSLVWREQAGPFAIAETVRDMAWHYFTQRATEDDGEGTIVDHVNQTYVGAHKNAIAMHGLELYLGRERMIEAIGAFLERYRFADPPLARMSDLVAAFREEAPANVQPIITDLFERRIIFDLAVSAAEVQPRDNGQYEVRIQTRARKFAVTAAGKSRAVEFDYPVPLVVFGQRTGAAGERDILTRTMVTPNALADGEVTVTVPDQPRMVGLDPFYRLLDRNYLDNRRVID